MIRNDKGRGFVYGCIPLLVSDVMENVLLRAL
jgi:hypothetical protein